MDAGTGGPAGTLEATPADRIFLMGPTAILRKALGPLLAYHILILGGAFFVAWGVSVGSRANLAIGVALIVAGIAVEVAVLVWSAGLTKQSARMATGPWPVDRPASVRPMVGPRFCTGCGWFDSADRSICPRCGRPLVRGTKIVGGI